jgi:indolepyruvate ferredoxin oxidoreductase beta subunit
VVSLGLFAYPEAPITAVREQGVDVRDFDAGEIARELGDLRLVNTVMLGAISEHLPFSAETLKTCVMRRFATKTPEVAALNAQAFDLGQKAGKKG